MLFYCQLLVVVFCIVISCLFLCTMCKECSEMCCKRLLCTLTTWLNVSVACLKDGRSRQISQYSLTNTYISPYVVNIV